MRFVDEVEIHVRAGAGGNGCVAFRREKHVPRGGPAGGDGGDGGDVVLEADPGLGTLLDLRYQREYRAQPGKHGQGHDRDGRKGQPCIIRVPCGTTVTDSETKAELVDLTEASQQFVVAAGGRGGRGNRRFASSTNRTPREAEPGGVGEERRLRLELKLIADVGLVGLPSVGKSTLISKISAARPRIADFPFTTLTPNLGLVRLQGDRSLVVADIPGLVEGAHAGVGLGHQFLRHVQRTRALVYMVDDRHVINADPGSPSEDLEILRRELSVFDSGLLDRPSLVVLNKKDLISSQRQAEIVAQLEVGGDKVVAVSAVMGGGIKELLETVWRKLHPTHRAVCEPDHTA